MNRPAFALPTTLAAALISLTGFAAHAGDLNTMMKEAGEWEVTMTGGPIPSMTQKGCYAGDKTVADLTHKGMKNCSQQSVNISGAMGTVDAVCQMQKMTVTVHSTIRSTGDAAFHSDSRIHLDGMPAIPGIPSDISMSVDGHRTGPCAPGEKPM
jgi:hypothetical protein